MEWMKSQGGNDVVVIDEESYINFGKEEKIKWIHLSYMDASGVRRGQILPIALGKIKREYSTKIGKKNLETLRGLIRENLEGDVLPRNKFSLIGEIINKGK